MIAGTTCILLEGNGWVQVQDLAKLRARPHIIAVGQKGPVVYKDEYEIRDLGMHLTYALRTAYDVFVAATKTQRFGAKRAIVRMKNIEPGDELYMYDGGALFHAHPIAMKRHTRGPAFDIRLMSNKYKCIIAKDADSRWANMAHCGMLIGDCRGARPECKEKYLTWAEGTVNYKSKRGEPQ